MSTWAYERRPLLLFALVLVVSGCAATVASDAGSDTYVPLDAMADAPAPVDMPSDVTEARDVAPDVARMCPRRLDSCDPVNPTACGSGDCGNCIEAQGFRPSAAMYVRYGAVCTRSSPANICFGRYATGTCFRGGKVCYAGAPSATSPPLGDCVDIDECVVLERISRSAARPGDDFHRCQWSDYTYMRTGTPARARCLSAPILTCGVGCSECPADRPICLYQSEVYPTGICVQRGFGIPPTIPDNPASPVFGHHCRVSPRAQCRFGYACLLPVRNNIDFPDENRLGACFSRDICVRFAEAFPDGYRCDTTLADP